MEVNITTKFNPGDKVYLLYKGRPTVTLVAEVTVRQSLAMYQKKPNITILYSLRHPVVRDARLEGAISEDYLFATAQELKDSLFAEIDKQ